MLFHRKVECHERVVSPIEQSRGCTVMLHQEIPFPLIGGQPPLDQLQSSPLEFAANLSLVSPVVFRPVKLRGQLPLRKRLTTIPEVFLFTAHSKGELCSWSSGGCKALLWNSLRIPKE